MFSRHLSVAAAGDGSKITREELARFLGVAVPISTSAIAPVMPGAMAPILDGRKVPTSTANDRTRRRSPPGVRQGV